VIGLEGTRVDDVADRWHCVREMQLDHSIKLSTAPTAAAAADDVTSAKMAADQAKQQDGNNYRALVGITCVNACRTCRRLGMTW